MNGASSRRSVLAAGAAGVAGWIVPRSALAAAAAWPALDRQLAAIARTSDGLLGVSAIQLATGREAHLNAERRFYMASVYKLPIACAALEGVDQGRHARGELEPLLVRMLGKSDNPATDELLQRLGGPPAVMAWLGRQGLRDIRVDRFTRDLRAPPQPPGAPPPGADLRDTCTPRGLAALLVALARGRLLSQASREQMLRILGAPDVVGPRRLPGLLPAGTFVAHKTGTNPQRVVNDVGIIRLPEGRGDLVVAAFLADSSREMPARERVLAEVGRAAYDQALRAGPK